MRQPKAIDIRDLAGLPAPDSRKAVGAKRSDERRADDKCRSERSGVKPAGPMVPGKGGEPKSPISKKKISKNEPPKSGAMVKGKVQKPRQASRVDISPLAPKKAKPMVQGKVLDPKPRKQPLKDLSPKNDPIRRGQGL